MANKLAMAHERRKLQLRATVLAGRSRIASEQERVKRARDELRSLSGTKRSNGGVGEVPGLRQVKVR